MKRQREPRNRLLGGSTLEPNTSIAGPEPTSIVTPDDLLRQYGERWHITCDPPYITWEAERRSADGRHRRFLAAHSALELAAKIAAAEVTEP
jgi:hypothetical protein